MMSVNVRREEHAMQPNRYIFKDAKGGLKKTFEKDWVQIDYMRKQVWAHCGKKTTYISDIESSNGCSLSVQPKLG